MLRPLECHQRPARAKSQTFGSVAGHDSTRTRAPPRAQQLASGARAARGPRADGRRGVRRDDRRQHDLEDERQRADRDHVGGGRAYEAHADRGRLARAQPRGRQRGDGARQHSVLLRGFALSVCLAL